MNYHDIKHDDMLNGDGLRVTLFVSGCSLHCPHCQNPQTWDKDSGILFDENAKQEIFSELSKDYISGLTLSGGHPLEPYNYNEVLNLCKEVKERFPNKTIWVYTGYNFNDLTNFFNLAIWDYIDVLVDGDYQHKLRDTSLKWRGSSNQRVINVNASKIAKQVILWCD